MPFRELVNEAVLAVAVTSGAKLIQLVLARLALYCTRYTLSLMEGQVRTIPVLPTGLIDTIGGVGAEVTVSIKLLLAVNEPSLTTSVIVAVPSWLDVGVTVTVRFVSVP